MQLRNFLAALILILCMVCPQLAKADNANPCTYGTIKEATWNLSSVTGIQIVTATTSPTTWTTICAVNGQSNASNVVTLEYGTGSVCATGTFTLEALTLLSGTTWLNGLYAYPAIPPTNNICITTSTVAVTNGHVSYVQTMNPF